MSANDTKDVFMHITKGDIIQPLLSTSGL